MQHGEGRPEIAIALIDGPVARGLPDLAAAKIHEVPGALSGTVSPAGSFARTHGTFVAAMLVASRGSPAPAICPRCTLLVRAIFAGDECAGRMPSATPEELAEAIFESVNAGAKIVNLSVALVRLLPGERKLEQSLDYAAQRGAIVVAAAGNQGTVGSTAITRHPWVIPVAACDLRGRPLDESNLGNSIGRRGLAAPGEGVTSLGPDGKARTFGGTSAAVPFVTGTAALLWSAFPYAHAAEVKLAATQSAKVPRNSVVPPLLDAGAAYRALAAVHPARKAS